MVRATTSAQLTNALAAAACGSQIVLGPGSYAGSFHASRTCPETAPLLLRAEVARTVTIGGIVTLDGAHVCLAHLDFAGPTSGVILAGVGNRVFGNRFRGWVGAAINARAGQGGEIAYNDLGLPAPWAPPAGVTQIRMGIRLQHNLTAGSVHRDGRIYANYLHDFPAKPIPTDYHSGQSDAITICEGPVPAFATGAASSNWIVERNLIERHFGGHGIVDVKCGAAQIRFNTVLQAPAGRIDIRIGRDSEFVGNWLENAGGMLLHGGFHRIIGNHLERTGVGISLEAGNAEWDFPGRAVPGFGLATRRSFAIYLAGNQAPIVVGKTYAGVRYTLPAANVRIEANTGPIILGLQQNTTTSATSAVPIPAAERLSPTEVGLSAMPLHY